MKNLKSFIGKITIVFCMTLMFGILGSSNVQAATIGQQLTAPESGWQRIEDTNSNFSYIGNWSTFYTSPYSGGSRHQCSNLSNASAVKFDFVGSKLRIISSIYPQYSDKLEISIDGNLREDFKENIGGLNIALVYEKTGLENKEHSVEITKINSGSYSVDFILDAIDIDSTGEIKPYNQDLENITLNKSTDNLQIGKTDTLTAAVTPDTVTNKTVIWKSSDESIATVDQTGKVTALKEGTATVTATTTDGSNLSASCTVTVNNAAVVATGIALNKTTDALTTGNTDQLSAIITPSNVTTTNATWTSSDPTIATVGSDGKVTAVKEGTVTITATTTDGSNLSASCTVNVTNQATITLSATASTTSQAIMLNWNTFDGATGYDVKRSTTQGNGYATIASNVTETTYNDNDSALQAGTTYYYIVTPIINGSEGTPSNEALAIVKSTIPTNPTDNSGNAILTITMTNGNVKSYTVPMTKVNDFISWYDNRVSGSTGKAYYTFDKTDSSQTSFSKKTEYIIFDKISSYEVDEYSK